MASNIERLKLVLTPLWTKEMGRRLKIAREKGLRTQAELAALMSTPERHVSQQRIAAVEEGRSEFLNVTYARLEAVLGNHDSAFVLIGRDAALYDGAAIGVRYFDYRQRAMRKRNGLDPKKGECPPWPYRFDHRTRVQMGREVPRKRGSVL